MHLNAFQIIVLPILAILFVERAAAVARGRIPRRAAAFWMFIWLAAGVAVAWPNLTTRIAKLFGIGGGSNLVLYSAVLFMLIGFYMTYVRLRRLDASITQLVRHLAIQNAQRGPDGGIEPPGHDAQKNVK
ncbi:MAG TPA: DUF2304 domain-containing protein [Phycisphaerae bacterium]|nr:DUF2304 domain-containing protein [Phycisphaerae bacterium]